MAQPPKFNGNGNNYDNYAFLLRNYCKANQYDDNLAIAYTISTLEERALDWYKDKCVSLGGRDPYSTLE